ncbi:unnamed protein product [Acanthoscelides obtectus]|uniref:Uncharacterized protein n=1 Tax=Acanthoscelides obtectus TaxID=200917 RepID=A0A9P0L9P4_ACAOB|nr:unnamed protein product [Acanthoscelides obtectus]CAK1624073.1 Retrovirus-related Gag polyprotein from transposon HMS-Beagle [Acanthoscelides obtectus]
MFKDLEESIQSRESNYSKKGFNKVQNNTENKEEEVPHHTFPLPSERNIHAVIRGVPATLSETEIKEELQQRGYSPLHIIRLKRGGGVPMPLVADNIPPFDGNPKQLHRFISSCENFLRAFQNTNNVNDPINICLLDTILSKLRDRAADLIGSRSELNSWVAIKDSLTVTFSDQRSIDCLIQDLISIRPLRNETPMQFGMRIQDARSLLFSKLNTSIENAMEKLIKIRHYDDFALKTFISGLPYQMQLVIRLRNPDSLEQALSFCTEEENFIYFNLEEDTLALLNSDPGNPITASQPLDSSRNIHILQDVQVAPPNNIQNESPKDSETETAHTCNAENNFNDGIPILDEIINNKMDIELSEDEEEEHLESDISLPTTNGRKDINIVKPYSSSCLRSSITRKRKLREDNDKTDELQRTIKAKRRFF